NGMDQLSPEPVDIEAVRRKIVRVVVGRAVELVDDAIAHVKNGNVQAMRYLFEIAGLFPVHAGDMEPANSELEQKLFDFLGGTKEPVADGGVATGSEFACHAVE
ncbi:MAG TPA: hypothetical protein VEI26_14690, partial [Terriglobales bacterium]|nr:hypothetical protein [Terriglobales bacterium]